MTKHLYLVSCLLVFILQQATAQSGKYDLQALLHQVDCDSMKASIDIAIKAHSASSTFDIAEQNYRLSFQREAISNPVIIQELDIAGPIQLPDGNLALYSPHSLIGSIDTVLSYNIELQSEHGLRVRANEWMSIGRLGFDIENTAECLNFKWHTTSAEFYPKTVIIEKFAGNLHNASEGQYIGLDICLHDYCSVAPIAQDDYMSIPTNQSSTINVLGNDVDLNGDINMSSFSITNTPPASQMTVMATSTPGEIVCTPAANFTGEVNTFEYNICDDDNQCVTGKVYVTVTDGTNQAPLALDDELLIPFNETMSFNVLQNDNDPDGNLDVSTFTVLSTPPAFQMTVTTTSNPGEIVCTPAQNFIGHVNEFEYQICDTENQCTTAKVLATVDAPTATTSPNDRYDIRLSPTAADNYVAIEYLNIPVAEQVQIVITDINGRMLQTHNKPISGNPVHRFDVSALPQGVYFLSTMIEGAWISRKFIKI